MRHLYVVGLVDRSEDFDPNKPYTGCRLCGVVFQDPHEDVRKTWSFNHARTHSEREHILLALSGCWCTPEAAVEFAARGIVPLSDMVLSEEHKNALLNATPIPVKEVRKNELLA